MIGKSLLIKEFLSTTLLPDHDATPKPHPSNDFLSKITIERWNQADLRYFDLHLDKAHRENEIVLIAKNVYNQNVVFFV